MSPRNRQRLVGARLNRRQFIGRAGMFAGAVALGPTVLAACGDDDDEEPSGNGNGNGTGATGTVAFENWPFYIDEDQQVFANFRDATGVSVSYGEGINSNEEYFATVREDLERGNPIGADIVVLTDWMAARWIDLGYVAELNKDNIPNAANLVSELQSPDFDSDRTYTLPWQSGITGIGYNPELTGREITSMNDIFDSEFAGHITILDEMRDTVGLVMLSMGVSPSEATLDEMLEAVARLEQARDDGQFRRVTGNDYGDDLAAGNTWIAIAWSGDVAQLQLDNPDLQFVVPDEGAMLWSDNMLVPVNASNQAGAEQLMNFVYDPEQAAIITNDVQFISPVEGVEEFMDPELAENPLINPTAEMRENLHIFRGLSSEEEEELVTRFEGLVLA